MPARDPDRLHELRTAIAENAVPGGSAYGRAAAEVIALTLRAASGQPDLARVLAETGTWLVDTKPSMSSMRNVVAAATEVMVRTGSGPAVVAAMEEFITASELAITRVAGHATEFIPPGAAVLFHSYSASLVEILGAAARSTADLTLLFTESRPYRESRRVVAALADTPARFIGYSDAAMAVAVAEADLVMVGADALFRDGSFANKVGSLPLALAARHLETPYYVVTERSKLYLGDPADVGMEQRPAHELADDWSLWASGRVEIRNQFFERVPASLVTAYLTDDGVVAPARLVDRARLTAPSA